jgi:hypothetical protein
MLHHITMYTNEKAVESAVILRSLKDAEADSEATTCTDEALMAGLNDYQKVILSVGSIIEEYDSDKKIPVVGFGAKLVDSGSGV